MEEVRVLVNHIGYEPRGYKNAVLQISSRRAEEVIELDPEELTGTLLPLRIRPADEYSENAES